jgi:hypothetical protein
MNRLRVERFAVTRRIGRLAVTSSMDCFAAASRKECFIVASRNHCLSMAKRILALLVSFSLVSAPGWAAPSSLGTVVYADRANLGATRVFVGTTIFSGDRISTDKSGSIQVRAGAARLLLSSASSAIFSEGDGSPAATLTLGSATFSTANSNAFVLHVATAVIRANSDQPTIGQVTVLNPKELIVKSSRGSLRIAVEDDVREIPEGAAYRVVLDPNAAAPQGPRGAGTKDSGREPRKAGKSSKFFWYAVAVSAGVIVGGTVLALHEVFESPDRP